MNTRVELIYDAGCPNVDDARAALLRAFVQVGMDPAWTEWDRATTGSPTYVRAFGSPTILVDGKDIAGARPGETAESCRLYDNAAGLHGTATVEQIAHALSSRATEQSRTRHASRYRGVWSALPGIGVSLLPAGLCPACWPAYTSLLGSLGLSFLLDEHYLLPLTAVLLAVALVCLAWRARSRRGYGPLAVGTLAVAGILAAKFIWSSLPLLHLSSAALLGCSLWNIWPRRAVMAGSCEKCAPQSQRTHPERRRVGTKT